MIPAAIALGLAVVLAFSGAAKLLDLRGSAATLRGFGIPERLVPATAVGLPLTELAIAAALVPAATSRGAALAATALFAALAIALAVTLARRRRPDCGCFGRLHSAPIGASTLARAAGLAAIAAFVAVPGTGTLVVLLLAATVAQALVIWRLLRRNGQLLERPAPARLEVGATAPGFALQDASGRFHTLDDLLVPGLPVALVFSDPDCAGCASLPARLAELREPLQGELAIALVTRGTPVEGPFEPRLYQDEVEVVHAYGVTHVPSALVVGPDGRVAGELAVGESAIEDLLAPRALRAVS